jgi:hypothetical protein
MSDNISHLLHQLAAHIPNEQQHLIEQLQEEITRQLSPKNDSSRQQAPAPTLDEKTGCYRQANTTNHYCPQCYDSAQQLTATQRINSKLRVCPQCRASIKPASKK